MAPVMGYLDPNSYKSTILPWSAPNMSFFFLSLFNLINVALVSYSYSFYGDICM